MTHEKLLLDVHSEPEFLAWAADVAPEQPVFWTEFYAVLKLLYEIYGLLKDSGFITRIIGKWRTAKAMRLASLPTAQERELTKVRDRYKR